MSKMSSESKQILCGFCPDEKCGSKLIFSVFDTAVECTQCGQKHNRLQLKNVEEVLNVTIQNVIQTLLVKSVLPKRGTETIKVLGLSNYYCKILSPLLTVYGMDKETSKAKKLSEMNQGDILDCGLFSDRAFLIDQEHISIPGYGRDQSGGVEYLSHIINLVKKANKGEERLVPIHADGDGHCLVHSISRALIGRELLWHPLRSCLKKHIQDNLEAYKNILKDFMDQDDWPSIIEECDPDFQPPEGEMLGLRNVHVFGLANVLKRPIILLDDVVGMASFGDYSALFLPTVVAPELCRGKDNHLNKPLCIAWSNSGHNHFIPLVGIKKEPLPVLTKALLPKAWGVAQSEISNYIEFDASGQCVIGGDRNLADSFMQRLIISMEAMYHQLKGVHPSIVADARHFLYQNSASLPSAAEIAEYMNMAIRERRLYRCTTCDALIEQKVLPVWFKNNGVLYNLALRSHGYLLPEKLYSFPLHGLVCRYDAIKDELQPDLSLSYLEKCSWCQRTSLRKVQSDGSIVYRNRDQTKTPSSTTSCSCGHKHYWEGEEYDNLPKELPVTLEWKGRVVKDTVIWFQNESNPDLNTNVFQVSSEVVQKHFPGEFGSERLQQRVVDQLLFQTKSPETMEGNDAHVSSLSALQKINRMPSEKLIISGKGILHKEELGASQIETEMLYRIQTRASSQQQKRQASDKIETISKAKTASPTKESISKSDISQTDETSLHVGVSTVKKKFAKVVTSDGRQRELPLGEEGMTLKTLQAWVNEEFQIPPTSQKIKYGFPPRELTSSSEEEDSQILALEHGDRVIVEICKQPDQPSIGSTFKHTSADILKDYQSLLRSDRLDEDIIAVLISSTLTDLSLWEYSLKYPYLFTSNGIFYQKMKRDIGLIDKKHFRLPMFPDKVFCYNAEYDRIDLCLEPNGHYPVTEGVEEEAFKAAREKNIGSKNCTTFSDSHTNTTDNGKKFNHPVPFQGAGYTLKEHQTSSRIFKTEDSGILRNVERKTASGSSLHDPVLVRKGPGFSVLSPPKTKSGSFSLERLQSLAHQVVNSNQSEEMNDLDYGGASEPAFPLRSDIVHAFDTEPALNFELNVFNSPQPNCDPLPKSLSDELDHPPSILQPTGNNDSYKRSFSLDEDIQDSGDKLMEGQDNVQGPISVYSEDNLGSIIDTQPMDVDNS